MVTQALKTPEAQASSIDALSCEVVVDLARLNVPDATNLMRTEDCRFSPDGSVLAVAGFLNNTISLFSIRHTREDGPLRVALTGLLRLKHPSLQYPHGLDFVDHRTLAVANRKGSLVVLRIPRARFDGRSVEARLLLESDRVTDNLSMESPGSVAVTNKGWRGYSAFVCLNYRHRVVQQRIRAGWRGHRVGQSRVILRQGLDIPDGIAICRTTGRMAISNHNEHAIRIYRSYRKAKPKSAPAGRLVGIDYPHGLRFFDHGKSILAADAGQPFVHLWRDPDAKWKGDRGPTASFRVMDEASFAIGRYNDQEGGPKGIDIHPSGEFLIVTSEHQPLGAFDLKALMRQVPPLAQRSDDIA